MPDEKQDPKKTQYVNDDRLPIDEEGLEEVRKIGLEKGGIIATQELFKRIAEGYKRLLGGEK